MNLIRQTGLTALAALVTMIAAAGPAAGQDENERLHFKTEAAEVRFNTVDPETGIGTSVWVYGADDMMPDRISKVVVAVDRYDIAACSGPKTAAEPGDGCVLFSAECYGELGDDAFGVDPNQLAGAWLTATVSCWEKVTNSRIELTVSVSWTATGEMELFRDQGLYHPDKAPGQPRGTETIHIQAFQRAATVTGSVSDGTNEYFLPGPDAEAWVARAQQVNT